MIHLGYPITFQSEEKSMSDFNEFMHYRVLAFKYSLRNEDLADKIIGENGVDQIPLRNVCAKLSPDLSDRIDRTVSVLGISKRLFIERALIEALEQVDAIMDAHQVPEEIEERMGVNHG